MVELGVTHGEMQFHRISHKVREARLTLEHFKLEKS